MTAETSTALENSRGSRPNKRLLELNEYPYKRHNGLTDRRTANQYTKKQLHNNNINKGANLR